MVVGLLRKKRANVGFWALLYLLWKEDVNTMVEILGSVIDSGLSNPQIGLLIRTITHFGH